MPNRFQTKARPAIRRSQSGAADGAVDAVVAIFPSQFWAGGRLLVTAPEYKSAEPPPLEAAFASRRLGAGEGLDRHLAHSVADLDRHAVVDHHADMIVAEQ